MGQCYVSNVKAIIILLNLEDFAEFDSYKEQNIGL